MAPRTGIQKIVTSHLMGLKPGTAVTGEDLRKLGLKPNQYQPAMNKLVNGHSLNVEIVARGHNWIYHGLYNEAKPKDEKIIQPSLPSEELLEQRHQEVRDYPSKRSLTVTFDVIRVTKKGVLILEDRKTGELWKADKIA